MQRLTISVILPADTVRRMTFLAVAQESTVQRVIEQLTMLVDQGLLRTQSIETRILAEMFGPEVVVCAANCEAAYQEIVEPEVQAIRADNRPETAGPANGAGSI